jgi:hypothetical protein
MHVHRSYRLTASDGAATCPMQHVNTLHIVSSESAPILANAASKCIQMYYVRRSISPESSLFRLPPRLDFRLVSLPQCTYLSSPLNLNRVSFALADDLDDLGDDSRRQNVSARL